MNGSLIALIVLAALSAGGVAYAFMFNRIEQERTTATRLTRLRSDRAADRTRTSRGSDPDRRRKSLQDTLKELEKEGQKKSRKKVTLNRRLEQAGLGLRREGFFMISAGVALLFFVMALVLRLPVYAWFVAAFAGGVGLPNWILARMRNRRLKKFREEFANAIDVIVRGVKAGLPLNDCIQIVAKEANEPVRAEFVRVVEAQRVGVSIADAIDRMPDNVPIPEVSFFAIVIGIQQRLGGNLSEALANLSGVLRDRKRMQGKIAAMSMEAKASGVIIAALPFVVMVLVFITSPDYIILLFTRQVGHVMLGVAAVWMSFGIITMRNMINFDF